MNGATGISTHKDATKVGNESLTQSPASTPVVAQTAVFETASGGLLPDF